MIEVRRLKGNAVYRYSKANNNFMFMIWAKCTLSETGIRKIIKAIETHTPEIVIEEYKISGLA